MLKFTFSKVKITFFFVLLIIQYFIELLDFFWTFRFDRKITGLLSSHAQCAKSPSHVRFRCETVKISAKIMAFLYFRAKFRTFLSISYPPKNDSIFPFDSILTSIPLSLCKKQFKFFLFSAFRFFVCQIILMNLIRLEKGLIWLM